MVEASGFRGVIEFLGDLGVYDIILPFLLVFTIVFAILEKTKILGVEKIDGRELTKKNLNSMVAFIMSFLVIASTQLVSVINEVMANVVLLLILAICFLMLVGVFFGDQEFVGIKEIPGWTKGFMVFMFIGVVAIFMNAIKIEVNPGESYSVLEIIFSVFQNWDAQWATSIIFLLVIGLFMFYIIKDPSSPKKEKKKED
jgi:hypothetical protein